MTQDFLFLEVEVLFCKPMLVQLGKQPYVNPKNQGLLLILKKKKKKLQQAVTVNTSLQQSTASSTAGSKMRQLYPA